MRVGLVTLEELALRAEARAKLTSDTSAANDLYAIAHELRLRLRQQRAWHSHLTPELIAEQAAAGAEGMDLLRVRIEQYGEDCARTGLLTPQARFVRGGLAPKVSPTGDPGGTGASGGGQSSVTWPLDRGET